MSTHSALSNRWQAFIVIGSALCVVLASVGAVEFLTFGVLIGACLTLPILLQASIEQLVALMLVLLITSRLALLVGGSPLVAYTHFGVFCVLLVALLYGERSGEGGSNMAFALSGVLLVVVLISSVSNGWSGLLPIIWWMTYAQPFVAFGLVRGLGARTQRQLSWVVMVLALIQIPLIAWQFRRFGPSDEVRGTFIEQGAGPHVLGALGVVAAAALFSRKHWGLPAMVGAGVFVSFGVFSDAKQLYLPLALGLMPLGWYYLKSKAYLIPVGVAGVLLAYFIVIRLNPAFAGQGSTNNLSFYAGLKASYMKTVLERMDAFNWAFGFGPGGGTSRVSMLTLPGFGSVPDFLVGGRVSSLAAELQVAHNQYWAPHLGSSLASPFFSFQGVFTDVGLVGLVCYLALWIYLWMQVSGYHPLARAIGRSLIIWSLGLGFIYLWLDEPAYVVSLAVVLAVLPACTNEDAPVEADGRHEDGRIGEAVCQANT